MHVAGLLIRGLRWGSATEGTLFVDGPLTASTLPAGVPGLSTSLNVVGRLKRPPASSSVADDLRKPVVALNGLTVQIQDDADGTAAVAFAADAGLANTSRWILTDNASVSAASTSFVLTGPTAPTEDQYLWLGTRHGIEAVRVDSVSTTGNVHACTVERGVLASHAKVHSVDPSQYLDDGQDDALVVWSRPPFGEWPLEAALYHFKMSDTDPHAVESCEWAWLGHVRERPKPQNSGADGWVWNVSVSHLGKAILDHAFPGAKEVETERCVRVVTRGYTADAVGPAGALHTTQTRTLPAQVTIDLKPFEAERLFNVRLRRPGNSLDSSTVTTFNSRLTDTGAVRWELCGEVGGYKWAWTVTKAELVTLSGLLTQQSRVRIHASLSASEPKAAIDDNPVSFGAGQGTGPLATARKDELNEGFVSDGQAVVFSALGEKPPKLFARVRLKTNFPEALLYLLLSGHGGGVNDSTYDKIVGGWGLGLDPAWVNTGTAGTPISDDEGTTEILEVAGILDETYDYAALPEKKLGDWLVPQLSLHTLLLGFVPTTGKLALRLWARKTASRTALNPVADEEVEPGETLEPLKYLVLKRGPDPVTLEFPPANTRAIQLPETRLADTKGDGALTVEIFKAGSKFTDAELSVGPLARFARAQVLSGHGEPYRYRIPVSISSGHVFGDLVSWTDTAIPTATGRGVSAIPLIVLGVDRDFDKGQNVLHCVRDVVNAEADASASAGKKAPALKVEAVWAVSGNVFTLVVSSLSDVAFRIDTSYGGTWATLASGSARVRVATPTAHNPSGSAERLGVLEASGTATASSYDSASKRSLLTVSFDGTWSRSGFTLSADIVKRGSYVFLADFRPSHANPEGANLQPSAAQGVSGRDFLKVGRLARIPSFDGRRSLIGS